MEIFELRPKNVPDVEKEVDRKILIQPRDEVPDPKNPGKIMWLDGVRNGQIVRREPDVMPPSMKIQVIFIPKPLLEKVNNAVEAHDIDLVVKLWKNARFEVEKISDYQVKVTMTS